VLLVGQEPISKDFKQTISEGLEAFIGATLCRVNRVPHASTTLASRRKQKAAFKAKSKTLKKEILMDELEIKKIEYSHLLYKLNMHHLQIFLQSAENSYLVDHFYQNNGIRREEKISNKPACRFDALEYLQSYSSNTNKRVKSEL